VRDPDGGTTGGAIEIEIWEVPASAFGGFVDGIPAPLGIGTLTLENGRQVKGFLCEAHATKGRARNHQPGKLAAVHQGRMSVSNGAAAARAKAQVRAHTADAAVHGAHGGERGFTKLDFELNDYPGPVKTSLFGIQHVLVMFTAMVGGPLIVGRLLNLPEETRILMVSGTMIGCGIATMVSALGSDSSGPGCRS
jgi:hypothetical protein